MPSVVSVHLDDRSYDIHIAPGLIQRFGDLFAEGIASGHVVIVTDETVADLYLGSVTSVFSGVARRCDSVILPTGETTKSVAHCEQIWQRMLALKSDRKTTVVGLGGGVIGDLAGFVASTYSRGIDFVQIPTTLMAQVDSSVGGKVGINLPGAKNIVGAFWQPKIVISDPDVLTTLDDRNYHSALAEVVKYGVIMDDGLFSYLENSIQQINQRDSVTMQRIIEWCCRLKAQIVGTDERDALGRRAILNYGHTFGHAIESVFGFGTYTHGQAVAVGMTCAARLAKEMKLVDDEFVRRQTRLLTALGLSLELPDNRQAELVEAMQRDKKVSDGTLYFVLPNRIGNAELVAAPATDLIHFSLSGV